MYMIKQWIVILAIALVYVYVTHLPQKVKNVGNPNISIVAFGDSLTAGKGVSVTQAYPAVLAEMLGRPVVNLGEQGQTAVEGAKRTRQALSYMPYMVLIEFGANDFIRAQNPRAAVEAIGQIVDSVQRVGAVAVIVDVGFPGMGAYSKEFQKLAKEKQALYVPGLMQDIVRNRKLKMADNVHPNAKGHRVIAEKIYKEIKPYIKERD